MTYSDRMLPSFGTTSGGGNPGRSPANLGTQLLPLAGVGVAIATGLSMDTGTRVVDRYDLSVLKAGTTVGRPLVFEGGITPRVAPTRMAQIRSIAGLTLRDWGAVFNVSHQTVKTWATSEPRNREILDEVLASLNQAAKFHPDVGAWLKTPVAGMKIRPLDLLRAQNWKAFHGAVRARAAQAVSVSPKEIERRRRQSASWVVPERAIEVAED